MASTRRTAACRWLFARRRQILSCVQGGLPATEPLSAQRTRRQGTIVFSRLRRPARVGTACDRRVCVSVPAGELTGDPDLPQFSGTTLHRGLPQRSRYLTVRSVGGMAAEFQEPGPLRQSAGRDRQNKGDKVKRPLALNSSWFRAPRAIRHLYRRASLPNLGTEGLGTGWSPDEPTTGWRTLSRDRIHEPRR